MGSRRLLTESHDPRINSPTAIDQKTCCSLPQSICRREPLRVCSSLLSERAVSLSIRISINEAKFWSFLVDSSFLSGSGFHWLRRIYSEDTAKTLTAGFSKCALIITSRGCGRSTVLIRQRRARPPVGARGSSPREQRALRIH